jgi:hypothetical protein
VAEIGWHTVLVFSLEVSAVLTSYLSHKDRQKAWGASDFRKVNNTHFSNA